MTFLKFKFSKKAKKIDNIITFDLILYIKCQINSEDFVNFCGLLRIHKLSCSAVVHKFTQMYCKFVIVQCNKQSVVIFWLSNLAKQSIDLIKSNLYNFDLIEVKWLKYFASWICIVFLKLIPTIFNFFEQFS